MARHHRRVTESGEAVTNRARDAGIALHARYTCVTGSAGILPSSGEGLGPTLPGVHERTYAATSQQVGVHAGPERTATSRGRLLQIERSERVAEHDLAHDGGREVVGGELCLPALDGDERPIGAEEHLVLQARARVVDEGRR